MALLWALAGSGAASEETIEKPADRLPLQTVVPEYPEEARRERTEGEVQVCFYIDRRGRPYRIAVRKSTHRIFERPSIRAVRASTYVALAEDEPLPTIKSCRTFTFRLTPVEPMGPQDGYNEVPGARQ